MSSASRAPRVLCVHEAKAALHGSVRVPSDLDLAARALLLAALGDGSSELRCAAPDPRALPLIAALGKLGVPVQHTSERISVQGVGVEGLALPSGALECGRSWISVALCAGLLAGQRFGTRIHVHPSLAARSVEPFVAPLRARGAQIAGARGEQETPPISVAPLVDDERLLGLRCELPVSDDAAKTAVLISGLFSPHATTLSEPFVSADHTERLFVALGLPLRRIGAVLQLDPSDWNRRIPAQRDVDTTGCATCAAFLATAALLVPGSRIALANVGTNPSRAGFFDVLRLWGANAQVIPRGDANGREPTADVLVEARALRGGLLGGEQLVRARNELPALAALAAVTLRDLQLFDLDAAASAHDAQARNLEALLQAFGFTTSRTKNTLQVQRRPQPAAPGARIDAREDPELAMAAVVLGLTAEGETVIEHAAEALELTHPGFLEALRELGAEVELA